MKKYIWRPFTQMQNISSLPEALSAKGSRIYLKNKKSVIDAISSWWVITLGHCHPSIVNAVKKQAQKLDQVLFANFSHEASEALIKELGTLLPSELSYFFFSDDGSTAVESALKMAVQSWKQKKIDKKYFIAFTHSYHGDTVGAMSVSGKNLFTAPYQKLLFPIIRAKQGIRSYDPPSAYLADFEKKLKKHHKYAAGVIIEPLVQGAGGMIMWPEFVVQEIAYLTKKYGLYLIFDEVMTGFGRTGAYFAFQKLNVMPDILCLSKGLTGGFLPLALTITNQEIYSNFLSKDKSRMFFHGHSFTANPISCAAATAAIQTMKKNKIQKEWKRIHNFQQKKVQKFKDHPKCQDARALGTIAALELKAQNKIATGYTSKFAEIFTHKLLKKGVFLRPIGNIIYILPPYSISNKELEIVWHAIEEEL